MTTPIHRSLAIALAAAIAASATTQAATITWGAATDIAGDLDVSTAGTLVVAHNVLVADGGNSPAPSEPFGPAPSPGPGDVIVNGVNFTGFIVAPLDTAVTVGSVALLAATPTLGGDNLLGSALPPFSNLSSDYQTLLRSVAGNFDFGQPVTLTLGGLTIGQTYAFQWWANASNSGYIDIVRANAGASVDLDANVGNDIGGTGQFAIGTFIADNASQDIVFESTVGGGAFLNAFQLRQLTQVLPPDPPVTAIPEPGSALVGMLVLGLCGARFGQRRGSGSVARASRG
jgi:hypothetical protein